MHRPVKLEVVLPMDDKQAQLVERIEQAVRLAFAQRPLSTLLRDGFGATTKVVNEIFGELGKSLGYEVAYPGDGGWLYDMAWSTVSDGMFVGQPLVLESEWKPGGSVPKSVEVDGDFQKLVQARADVRVWITACPNQEITEKHISNCKRQVHVFGGTAPGDTYIFIVYDWTTKETRIERFQADLPRQNSHKR
jgi:hypothetical protein